MPKGTFDEAYEYTDEATGEIYYIRVWGLKESEWELSVNFEPIKMKHVPSSLKNQMKMELKRLKENMRVRLETRESRKA